MINITSKEEVHLSNCSGVHFQFFLENNTKNTWTYSFLYLCRLAIKLNNMRCDPTTHPDLILHVIIHIMMNSRSITLLIKCQFLLATCRLLQSAETHCELTSVIAVRQNESPHCLRFNMRHVYLY